MTGGAIVARIAGSLTNLKRKLPFFVAGILALSAIFISQAVASPSSTGIIIIIIIIISPAAPPSTPSPGSAAAAEPTPRTPHRRCTPPTTPMAAV